MSPTLHNLRRIAGPALVAAALGAAYAPTLAPSVTWANDGADSGDLVAAAATLGVAHPTGYPTYLLLARAFLLIPLGEPALRASLLSAAAALGAALVVYAIVRRLAEAPHPPPASPAAGEGEVEASGLVAALAVGLAPLVWSQAAIPEVYALGALFFALVLLFIVGDERPTSDERRATSDDLVAPSSIESALPLTPSRGLPVSLPPRLRVALFPGLLVGLALGNHVTIAIAALAWLAIAWWRDRPGARLGGSAWRLAGIALGLLVYLYLPLRARAHPPVNWGDPRDWAGFWWVVSGAPYRGLAFGLPSALIGGRVEAWAALLIAQFGWVGLALGFAGLVYGAPGRRRFVWVTAALAAIVSAFAIGYDTADSQAYLIPFYIIFGIWLGLGVARLLALAARWRGYLAPLLALALLAWLGGRAADTLPRVDASQDRRAADFAARVLADAPPGAIVVTSEDRDTFALWYAHYALGRRPDLAVVVEPLLDFDWYRRNLRAVYPALAVPEAREDTWRAALAAANGPARRVCHTDLEGERALVCGEEP